MPAFPSLADVNKEILFDAELRLINYPIAGKTISELFREVK